MHGQEAGPTGMHGRAWGVDAAMDAALAVPLVCRVLVDSLTCAGDLRSLSLVAKRFSAIRGALLPHCDPPLCTVHTMFWPGNDDDSTEWLAEWLPKGKVKPWTEANCLLYEVAGCAALQMAQKYLDDSSTEEEDEEGEE